MVNYYLVKPTELNQKKWESIRPQFINQLQSYEKEIGGVDMGMGFFLREGSHVFLAEKNGKLLGWFLGTQPNFGGHFKREKSFMPGAIYIDPSERFSSKNKNKSFNNTEFVNKLFENLKKNNFDFYYVVPDYGGILTEKGKKYLKKVYDMLELRKIANEGYFKDSIAYSFSLKRTQKRYERSKLSTFEKNKKYFILKAKIKLNRIKRRVFKKRIRP